MKFYNASRLIYPETDASGVSLGGGLLQVRKTWIVGVMKYQTIQLYTHLFVSTIVI